MRRNLLLLLPLVIIGGCRFGQLPNPNAAKKDDPYDGKALQERVRRVGQVLSDRVLSGQLDKVSKSELLSDYIDKQLEPIDLAKVEKKEVWRFADVARQAGDWERTRGLYELAVQNASDDDRRVNDSIRLAEAMAKLGDVAGGIETVRSTFDAAPGNKAPILLATLYEFVPAALGQGHDVDVALLLEDAVDQHLKTVVDPNSKPGQDFMRTRRYHVDQAWKSVISIMHTQGTEEQFREALQRSDDTLSKFARV